MTDVVRRDDGMQIGRALRLDRRTALELLRDLARDGAVLSDLRKLWARETGRSALCFAPDHEVLSQLAARVASGALVIARVRPTLPKAPPPGEGAVAGETAVEEAAAVAEQVAEEKSWIELTVVRLDTGAKVAGVPLLITPASGSEAEHKTDDQGVVRLDGITKGPCLVRCKLGDVTRPDVLIFMGTGSGGPPPAAGGTGAGKSEKKGGTPSIVAIEKHKVKSGETLDGLAKLVESTWQKVAKLNWGTDDPKKINRFLRTVVGCTKKTKDGKSYVFDDSDAPGIILLPTEWKAKDLDTGHAYTIEVVPAVEAKTWVFSM